jgi:hypothetical protein
MSNVEATQAGKKALYSPAEINTLKNSIIDLTESDITTSIMAKVELELSSFNELAARALKYNNGDTVPIYSVEKGRIVPTKSEADYTRIRYANAAIHANSLNEVIFGNIIP